MSRLGTTTRSDATLVPGSRTPRWDPGRVAGAGVLAAWAGLFWFLLATDRVGLYLSGRTSWVVPVGAVLLTLAAVGRLAAARVTTPALMRRREAIILALMVAPVMVITALPAASLGTFSAQRKSTDAAGYWTQFGAFSESSSTSWPLIAAARFTPEGKRILAARAGEEAAFTGFVSRVSGTSSDEFLLTRFVINCCVADAAIIQIRVVDVPAGSYVTDQWVEVTGQLYPVGDEVILTPTSIEQVDQPSPPYLST